MELHHFKLLSPYDRRRLRMGHRGAYVSRPRYGAQELESWLRKHEVTSANKLRGLNKEMPDAPTVDFCIATFGSWSNTMAVVWGEPPAACESRKMSEEELIALAVRYKVYTATRWDKLRSSDARLFPPRCQVTEMFGNWNNFQTFVSDHSCARAISQYRGLSEKLGRPPTVQECRRMGISLPALRKVASKRTLDEVLAVQPTPEPPSIREMWQELKG